MCLKVVNRVCLESTFYGVVLLIFQANGCDENTFSHVDVSVDHLYLHDAVDALGDDADVSPLHHQSLSEMVVLSVFETDIPRRIHQVWISVGGMTFCDEIPSFLHLLNSPAYVSSVCLSPRHHSLSVVVEDSYFYLSRV